MIVREESFHVPSFCTFRFALGKSRYKRRIKSSTVAHMGTFVMSAPYVAILCQSGAMVLHRLNVGTNQGTAVIIFTSITPINTTADFDIDMIEYAESDDSDDDSDDGGLRCESVATIVRLKDANTLELVFPMEGFRDVEPFEGFQSSNRPENFDDQSMSENSPRLTLELKRTSSIAEDKLGKQLVASSTLDLLLTSLRSVGYHQSTRRAIATQTWRDSLKAIVEGAKSQQKLQAMELLQVSLVATTDLGSSGMQKMIQWLVRILTLASPEVSAFAGQISTVEHDCDVNLRRSALVCVGTLCENSGWRAEVLSFLHGALGEILEDSNGMVLPTEMPPISHLSGVLLLGGSLDVFEVNETQTTLIGDPKIFEALTRLAQVYLSQPLCEPLLQSR
eukprot:SAG11_NODE_104_length_16539_cov_8.526642_17_plen_391_part_01